MNARQPIEAWEKRNLLETSKSSCSESRSKLRMIQSQAIHAVTEKMLPAIYDTYKLFQNILLLVKQIIIEPR